MRGIIKDGVYRKLENEKQKLRIGGGSWTINMDEIFGRKIREIVYQTPKAIYSISLEMAIEKGFNRNLGGENKLVVPLKYWKVT